MAETKGVGFNYSTVNTFILNKSKTLKAGINYSYQAPQYDLLYKNKSTSSLDLSFKYFLQKNNLQIALTIQDVFRTNMASGTTYTSNIKQINSSYSDRRSFRLSIIYKFGSKKINIDKREFGNTDEKNRTGE